MLYLILLLLLISGVYIEWTINGFEIVSPVSLMLLGLALADVLAMVGRSNWNNYDLSGQVFLIIALGAAALLLGSFLAQRARATFAKGTSRESGLMSTSDGIAIWKYVVLSILVLIAAALRMSETIRLAAELGVDASSYSVAAKAVRSAFAAFNSADGMQIGKGFSFLSRQMSKVESCISYISVYLLARSLVNHRKWEVAASSVLAVLCGGYVIVSGSRAELLYLGIAFAIVLYLLLLQNGCSARKLTFRFFFWGVILGIVLSVGFWLLSALVGQKTRFGFVEYISFYYGCGLPSLESFLETKDMLELVPGLRSFYYLFAIPYKLGFISDYPSYSIGWISLGPFTSNIFTGFARYYLDFGLFGLVVLSCASSFIFTSVYKASKTSNTCILIVLTGYFCAQCFDFAREEFLFSRFFATSSVIWLFILFLLLLFITSDLGKLRSRFTGNK